MARVTKDADVRRDELLDVALDLCMTVGFESASVEQITTAAGVAKGTFYHYFTSKQDLLVQLVDRFGDELFTYLEDAMQKVGGDAPTRLLILTSLSAARKLERLPSAMASVPYLYMEENYTLRHKLFSAWLARTRPLLLGIVEQGAREGTFDIGAPGPVTDIILSLWFDYANRLWEDRALLAPDDSAYVDALTQGVEAMFTAQERILGVPKGSLHVQLDASAMQGTREQMLRGAKGSVQEVGQDGRLT
jgi:AcrR family transcriptional regulator